MENIIVNTLDHQRLWEWIQNEKSNPRNHADSLRKLADELSRATIYQPAEIPPDIVTMNSEVSITNLSNNQQQTIKLVYPNDADIASKRISIFAPIATALLGFRVGDVVQWPVPKGVISLRIDAIVYQPEASGDFTL